MLTLDTVRNTVVEGKTIKAEFYKLSICPNYFFSNAKKKPHLIVGFSVTKKIQFAASWNLEVLVVMVTGP